MRITLKDLARQADVSINTVSRALRNCDDISLARRQQIQKLAARLGYKPDPALSALSAYRQRIRVKSDFSKIAVLSYWKNPDNWMKSISGQSFWTGAEERARQLGYELEFFWLGTVGMSPRRASRVLNYRGVRGVIVPPLPPDATRLKLDLDWTKFSVVTLERSEFLPNFIFVAPNYYSAMAVIWQQLWDRGYKRPGLLLNEDNAGRSNHQWEAAMLLEQQRHLGRIDQGSILVHSPATSVASFTARFGSWRKAVKPDALIVRSNYIARYLADQNIQVPMELGLVGLNVDDDYFGSLLPAGVDQQRRVMGATAVDLVNNLLLASERGPAPHIRGMIVDGVWRDGATLRRRRQT